MTEQGEYVSRREFEARSQQTNEKIENLRSDMKAGFLQLTERMDDKFERMNDRFERMDDKFERMDDKFERMNDRFERMDGKFEEVHRELNRQNEKAEERQKSDRRFWLTTAIALITVAATIMGLLLNMK